MIARRTVCILDVSKPIFGKKMLPKSSIHSVTLPQDYYNHINDIHYVQINSASYQWLGEGYQEIRYSEKVDETHPWIKYTVPYREPLWAVIEISKQGRSLYKGKNRVLWVPPR